MNKIEKIANAKKRINELERLITYWDNENKKNMKKNNFDLNANNVAI